MTHDTRRTSPKRASPPKARRPRPTQADPSRAPGDQPEHVFPANIQRVLDETSGLSAVIQEWLARGIEAIVCAVKHQLALLAAPPERGLLPPPAADGDADEDPGVAGERSRRR
mgnify:CR=1 FL=1